MRSREHGWGWVAGIAAAAFAAASAVPDALGDDDGVAATGRADYEAYCQVCHGADGTGNGPFANALDTPPSDLTTIAKRRGGRFSATSLAEFIDGRHSPRAHGRPEMPIWGRELRSAPGLGRDTAVRGRIYVLIAYLKTLQEEPPAEAVEETEISIEDVGWRVFTRRCAICHGYDGTGDGYLAPLLVVPAPDLTRIATRRDGQFNDLEIAAWIDGRSGQRAHGPREMPIWGEKLGEHLPAAPGREAAVRGEIQLLVAYLRSIQAPENP